MKIYLKAEPLMTDKYQKLLVNEWSPETMKESLNLADSFLNNSELPLGFSKIGKHYDYHELSEFFTPSHFIDYLKDQSALLNNKNMPNIPKCIPKRRDSTKIEYSKLTLEVIYNLAFPVFSAINNEEHLILEGDIGFFRDIQSLIFILTSDYVLPFLRKNRLREEFDYLNLIMFTYSLYAWHDNPAHQNQLFSIVFNNMGLHEAVIECLYTAFRLTAPEDHDYLTKAQTYWTALIDAKMFDDAKKFTLRLLQNSLKEHFEEIKEIIELSFELERKGR